jgi:fatty-acyl-CoA synthase
MKTLTDVLARLDRGDAGLTFLEGGKATSIAYAELAELVRGNVEHFAALGVRPGDRVAIALETDPEHIVAFLALVALGAVPLSVKPRRGPEADYALDVGRIAARFAARFAYRTLPSVEGVTALAWDASARSTRPGAIAEADPGAVAFVQFSSGSIAEPKAVPIRHENLAANLAAIAAIDGRNPETIGYNFLPLSHDMGLIGGLLSNLVWQNPIYLSATRSFLRRPTDFFRRRERGDVTVAMPDFALRYLVRNLRARDRASDAGLLACLKAVYCGAEPIRYETIASTIESTEAFGFDPRALVFSYGMAEATLVVTARRFDALGDSFLDGPKGRRVANVGAPVAGTEVLVGGRDAGGTLQAAPPGVEATIYVRGPGVFGGYLGGEPLTDGWHDTGDLGFMRGGDLYVSGRVKDVIIVNGENLFPDDIEAFVGRLPGVEESMAMSDGDDFYVLVVGERDVDPQRVAAEVGAQFGAFPAKVVLGASRDLRRTTSGKPMRQATLSELRRAGAV